MKCYFLNKQSSILPLISLETWKILQMCTCSSHTVGGLKETALESLKQLLLSFVLSPSEAQRHGERGGRPRGILFYWPLLGLFSWEKLRQTLQTELTSNLVTKTPPCCLLSSSEVSDWLTDYNDTEPPSPSLSLPRSHSEPQSYANCNLTLNKLANLNIILF